MNFFLPLQINNFKKIENIPITTLLDNFTKCRSISGFPSKNPSSNRSVPRSNLFMSRLWRIFLVENGRLKLIGTEFSASKDCIRTIRNSALHCQFMKLFMFELVTKTDGFARLYCRLFDSYSIRTCLNPFSTWKNILSNESCKRAIKEKNCILLFLHVSFPLVAFSGNTARENNFFITKKENDLNISQIHKIFLKPLLLFVSDTKEMAKFDFHGIWFVLCIIKGSYFSFLYCTILDEVE